MALELASLLLVAVSARRRTRSASYGQPKAGARLLGGRLWGTDRGALIVALTLLSLTVLGRASLGTWAVARASVIFFGVALLALPFGLSVSWGRSGPRPDAT